MLSSLQNKNVVGFFQRLAVRPGSVMPIVLSSKVFPLLEMVEWCLVAPLCWGEIGARKGKAFKTDGYFFDRSALLSD